MSVRTSAATRTHAALGQVRTRCLGNHLTGNEAVATLRHSKRKIKWRKSGKVMQNLTKIKKNIRTKSTNTYNTNEVNNEYHKKKIGIKEQGIFIS